MTHSVGSSAVRRTGALVVLLGLLLVGFASFAGTAGATTPTDNDNKVCNNQKGDPSRDCVGDSYHGDVSATFDASGNLVFDITATNGFTGWNDLFICIPGTPRTTSADCQGNTASVLSPAHYDVTTPSTNSEGAKDVTFACSTHVTAVVDASVLPSGTFPWTLHLAPCQGGTDEAFGSATPPTDTEGPTYECLAPTGVTATGATLHAKTSDADVDRAVFTVQNGPSVTDGTGTADADQNILFDGAVTGLTANTVYTYKVDFFTGDSSEPAATATGCEFSTAPSHTYACAAPQNVTQTAARLRGTTDDATVTATEFTVGSGTPVAGTSDATGSWYADVTNLPAGTTSSYTVTFTDGATTLGSASCQVATGAVIIPAVEETTTTTAPPARATEVQGEEVVRTDPAPAAAPAVEATQLPRTGASLDILAGVGLLLVLAGAAMVFVRPAGDHYA